MLCIFCSTDRYSRSSPNVLFTNKKSRALAIATAKPVKYFCTDIVGGNKLGSEYTAYIIALS